MSSGYYDLKRCKTCKWWEPYSGACCNGDSENRGAFMLRDDTCNQHERHQCRCSGCLEAREQGGKIWYYCYSCHFDFDWKPYEGIGQPHFSRMKFDYKGADG